MVVREVGLADSVPGIYIHTACALAFVCFRCVSEESELYFFIYFLLKDDAAPASVILK